ncbi:hypothetical protein [Arthrobacter sp. B0490]|uniref:hypothetical protein n=1 Tax=Arthrobacter sp. B0490 TaxID=2058891 RepID=UPI001CA55F1C|nr:hypothetical protein [Arthrobacter sp. B0490]
MNSPDHGARDASISTNSYTTVVGRKAVPEASFRAYWRDVHGPLCSRVPGLGWYVQHHFAQRQDSHLWAGPASIGVIPGYELDGAVEIGWTTADTQAVFQDAASILFSDEQNVFEETAAYPLPAGSTTVFDHQLDATPNGQDTLDRLHVHFTPKAGQASALATYLREDFAGVARESQEVVKVRVHAPDDHDNSTPNPPAPNVEHTVIGDRVSLVILEIAFIDPLARRRFYASPEYQSTLTHQEDLAAFITAFPVSGVFTFVRDGELTTAGLRGSRVAELITAMAASNQVEPAVQTLMHTGRMN